MFYFNNTMKKLIILLLFGILIIGGCGSQQNEIDRIQSQIDNYLIMYPEFNGPNPTCQFKDTGLEITIQCPGGNNPIESYNDTHDKVSIFMSSSGGAQYIETYYIPHTKLSIKKSEKFKLVRDGPIYYFEECSDIILRSVYDDTGKEKILPWTVMESSEAEKYIKTSKERCLGYITEEVKSVCIKCLVYNGMGSLGFIPDEDYCNEFEQYIDFGICIGNIASFNSDITICENRIDQIIKDMCYYQYAVGHRETIYCNQISDTERREGCVSYVNEVIWDVGSRE